MVDPQVVEYLIEEGGEYAGGGTSSMLSPDCGNAAVVVESGSSGCNDSDVEDEKVKTRCCLVIVVVVGDRVDGDEASDGKGNFSLERFVGVIGGSSDEAMLIM